MSQYAAMLVENGPKAFEHVHRWVAVAIVYLLDDGDNQRPAVAQSCHCGAVQAVVVPGALR